MSLLSFYKKAIDNLCIFMCRYIGIALNLNKWNSLVKRIFSCRQYIVSIILQKIYQRWSILKHWTKNSFFSTLFFSCQYSLKNNKVKLSMICNSYCTQCTKSKLLKMRMSVKLYHIWQKLKYFYYQLAPSILTII